MVVMNRWPETQKGWIRKNTNKRDRHCRIRKRWHRRCSEQLCMWPHGHRQPTQYCTVEVRCQSDLCILCKLLIARCRCLHAHARDYVLFQFKSVSATTLYEQLTTWTPRIMWHSVLCKMGSINQKIKFELENYIDWHSNNGYCIGRNFASI